MSDSDQTVDLFEQAKLRKQIENIACYFDREAKLWSPSPTERTYLQWASFLRSLKTSERITGRCTEAVELLHCALPVMQIVREDLSFLDPEAGDRMEAWLVKTKEAGDRMEAWLMRTKAFLADGEKSVCE